MDRSYWGNSIMQGFQVSPIVALLGPRQCGKTTVARQYARTQALSNFFDLEDARDFSRLAEPYSILENLEGLIVIDEVQYGPHLFQTLRVLADQKKKQKFLILGSASGELIKHASETLAGRIFHIEMTPFALHETHQTRRLMERGGFPLSYLAETLSDSILWREQFITTFLERDIPKLGINIPSHTLRRFWMMLAHYHGNVLNASELGRSLGTNHITIQRYLDILAGTYMVRILPPWFENIQKRQVKSPKIYLRDAGIFQTLLSLNTTDAIFNHPKAGAFWEGFALEEILRAHEVKPGEAYFWSTHAEAELDLFVLKNNTRIGYEFKYADAPKRTKSMSIALNDLKLDELRVIYPGDTIYALDSKIVVMPLLEALNRKQ